ncbi:hypothetical protein V8E51_015570 [Hyaloscypha variabilis]
MPDADARADADAEAMPTMLAILRRKGAGQPPSGVRRTGFVARATKPLRLRLSPCVCVPLRWTLADVQRCIRCRPDPRLVLVPFLFQRPWPLHKQASTSRRQHQAPQPSFACDDRPQYALDLQAISRTAAPSLPALDADADARLYLSVASPTSYVRMQKRAGLENSTWPCTLPDPRTAVKLGRLGCIKSILNCMESFADIPQASAAACTARQTQHTLKITSCPCHLIPS